MSNFHTHNHLCKHAGGTASDYVKEAIKHGYKEIGISDHGPLPNQPFPRMSMQEFNEIYLVEIAEARLKYGNQIKIYSGLEIEYLDDIDNYYRQLLKKLDYLILGCHYYSSGLDIKEKSSYEINNRKKLAEYTKLIKKALSTKMFRVLAHPDLFMCGYQKFDKYARKYSIRIIKCANKNQVFLEYNANGIRNQKEYPSSGFWELAKKYNAKVIVSSDCHNPKNLEDEAMLEARANVRELGLDVYDTIFE